MRMRSWAAKLSVVGLLGITLGQVPSLRPVRGLREEKPSQVALVGVRVWMGPGQVLSEGAILLNKGKIVYVGPAKELRVPKEAQVRTYPPGTWVYPAFVEPWVPLESPAPSRRDDRPQYESGRHPLLYPNEAIRMDFAAETSFVYEETQARRLRQMGFAVAHMAPKWGILRGTGATVALGEELSPEERFLGGPAVLHAGFEKGPVSQEYPNSKMGAIALVRQFLYDWLWYRQMPNPPLNVALERLKRLAQDTLRWCWVAQTPEDAFRVAALMREWRQAGPLRWALLSTGYEYEWLPHLPSEGLYILPVGLPTLPPPHSPDFYARLPLTALRRWETAPFRLKWLVQAGYKVAFTSQGLSEPATFWEHLRTLARTGVHPDTLLQALTVYPAQWLGLSDVGRIAENAQAHLLVFSDTLWKPDAYPLELWVKGRVETLNSFSPLPYAGTYALEPMGWRWILPSGSFPLSSKLIVGQDTHRVAVQYDPVSQTFTAFLPEKVGVGSLYFTLQGGDTLLRGHWRQLTEGYMPWRGIKLGGPSDSTVPSVKPLLSEDSLISRRTFPNSLYGYKSLPMPEKILFRGATVWTGDTVLPETDVYVAGGKILRIGRNLFSPPDAQVIEAQGKALTAGIIDEHSHIAIEGGVNEATDAVTPEVRIRDVIDPTDVNIYRHLAGGVVAVQLLHGSANPIGGQSACVKLKWGFPADSFLIPDAPPFNKFALGENVKQSNWGEAYTIRYPQTRMGVEQIIADAFEAAQRYGRSWQAYEAAKKKGVLTPAPRRDLRYEALHEILQGKRFITCHSYVQSEILMLMRLAERYGFRVRTFTHVLEGYKVADELKAHGAFASTFSDWWAYKYEVVDAIPHNAALLLKKGVPVCINSDDAEMGRRLNQEAAKVLRYGGRGLGIDSIEAWRTVTVYPARALGISHRTGYIREGYDADLVLWSASTPLSVQSQPLLTLVEGRRLYDKERDRRRYEEARQEKARLLDKAWRAAQTEAKGVPLLLRRAVLWDCESLGEEAAEEQP